MEYETTPKTPALDQIGENHVTETTQEGTNKKAKDKKEIKAEETPIVETKPPVQTKPIDQKSKKPPLTPSHSMPVDRFMPKGFENLLRKDASQMHKSIKNQLVFQARQKESFSLKMNKMRNEERLLIDPIFELQETMNCMMGIGKEEKEQEESESEVEVLLERDSILGIGVTSDEDHSD